MSWQRKIDEKRRLEKMKENHAGRYTPLCLMSYRGNLYRRYDYSSNYNTKKYWRRHSNRRFRRNKEELLSGGMHKKTFDLWWTLW